MKSEPGDAQPNTMVFSVLLVLPQTFVKLFQKQTIQPITLSMTRKVDVSLIADLQHPELGRRRPLAWVGWAEPMPVTGAYGFRAWRYAPVSPGRSPHRLHPWLEFSASCAVLLCLPTAHSRMARAFEPRHG